MRGWCCLEYLLVMFYVTAIREDRTRGGRSYYAGSINPKAATMSGGISQQSLHFSNRAVTPVQPVVTSHRTMIIPSSNSQRLPVPQGNNTGQQVLLLTPNLVAGLQPGITVLQPNMPKVCVLLSVVDITVYDLYAIGSRLQNELMY